MKIKKYYSTEERTWNQFIQSAKNSTFLFNRKFMDYHSDRYIDHSLMIYDKTNLIACFPANEANSMEIVSHQGLTYGGLIIRSDSKLTVYLEVFGMVLKYYYDLGFKTLKYKAFPRFYNVNPTDEIEYCLYKMNADLYRKDVALVVDQKHRIKYSGNYRREAKKAKKEGIKIEETGDFEEYWDEVLTPNLQDRFGVSPVHSKKEILLLKRQFPDQIKLYVAIDNEGRTIAGSVIFYTKTTAHCQYNSATEAGRYTGALNLLFITLLDYYSINKRYFDFGIANENDGKDLNYGLLAWKERMGGRAYAHDFYKIYTKQFSLLH